MKKTEEKIQTPANEHKIKNGSFTTITAILNDGWKGVGKTKFKSRDGSKTLMIDLETDQCNIY